MERSRDKKIAPSSAAVGQGNKLRRVEHYLGNGVERVARRDHVNGAAARVNLASKGTRRIAGIGIKDHAILGLDGSAFRGRYHDWRDGCARGGRGAARRRGSLNGSVRLKTIEIAEASGKVAGPHCRSQNRGECLQGAMV